MIIILIFFVVTSCWADITKIWQNIFTRVLWRQCGQAWLYMYWIKFKPIFILNRISIYFQESSFHFNCIKSKHPAKVTLSVSSIPRPHEDWKVIKQSVYLQGTGMNILMHLFIRNRYGKFNALKNVYPEHNFKNGILPRIFLWKQGSWVKLV
jgi:hypothetical protein